MPYSDRTCSDFVVGICLEHVLTEHVLSLLWDENDRTCSVFVVGAVPLDRVCSTGLI